MELQLVQTIPAANFTRGRIKTPRVVVLHSTESPERTGGAVAVARYFATPTTRASAHYVVDHRTVVSCVPETDTAWHAPGANADGLGIELVGRAAQTPAQWADPYSAGVLNLAAVLVAELCDRWNIPATYVDARGLVAGLRGITMHRDVTAAYHKSTHSDPGSGFPIASFIAQVAALRSAG